MAEPHLFAELVGQTLAVQLLQAALERGRLAPAYLFMGPDGVGRRLAAHRFLEGVMTGGCPDGGLRRRLAQGNLADLLWIEPTYTHQGQLVPVSKAEALGVSRRSPPQIRLDQVREAGRFLARRPIESPRPLVVIETAEAMPEAAANALLKTLEEPGDGLLILISAAPERLLVTIRSRCQGIPFQPLSTPRSLRCWPGNPSPLRALPRRIPSPFWLWPGGRPGPFSPTAASGIACRTVWPSGFRRCPPILWGPWTWPGR